MEYLVGQQVAPGLVVVQEDTLRLLREQADAKNDLRAELSKLDLQNDLLTKQRDGARSQADTFLKSLDEELERRQAADRLNGEKDKHIALLEERIRGLLPHRGGTMSCMGPGCPFCDDEESQEPEKRKDETPHAVRCQCPECKKMDV